MPSVVEVNKLEKKFPDVLRVAFYTFGDIL